MMKWGTRFPKEIGEFFWKHRKNIKQGKRGKIRVYWGRKKPYLLELEHIKRKKREWRLRWDVDDRQFLNKVRRTFVQSYFALKGQREAFSHRKTGKKRFKGKLPGGKQEVLIFRVLNENAISCKVFIQIKNDWNALFERLADENVFGWLFVKGGHYLIARSTSWIPTECADSICSRGFLGCVSGTGVSE